jgi:hypothetical protein
VATLTFRVSLEPVWLLVVAFSSSSVLKISNLGVLCVPKSWLSLSWSIFLSPCGWTLGYTVFREPMFALSKREKVAPRLCMVGDGASSPYLQKVDGRNFITSRRLVFPMYHRSAHRQMPCHHFSPFELFVLVRSFSGEQLSDAIYLDHYSTMAASSLLHLIRALRCLLRSSNGGEYFKP